MIRVSFSDGDFSNIWHGMTKLLVEEREHKHQGSRDGRTTELLGANFLLTNTSRGLLQSYHRPLSIKYAATEVAWYLLGRSDTKFMEFAAPSYKRFAEADGTANGAYGGRLRGGEDWIREIRQSQYADPKNPAYTVCPMHDQLTAVTSLLIREPDTRRAVISLWSMRDLPKSIIGSKDVPCTLTIQFLVREGALHCFVNMRSNDVWLGLPYDVFAWTFLQGMIAEALGIRTGHYYHSVASMHMYDRNAPSLTSQDLSKRPPSLPNFWSRGKNEKISEQLKRFQDAVLPLVYDSRSNYDARKKLSPAFNDLFVAMADGPDEDFISPAFKHCRELTLIKAKNDARD